MVKYRPYLGCLAFPQAAYTNSILTSRISAHGIMVNYQF